MTVLLFIGGVLLMAIGLDLSIALHEVGHLAAAKAFGVRVSQYMIGFGPTLWSTRRGETEYGIKAIPLGGYIRMIGMFPPRTERRSAWARRWSSGRLGAMMDDAREQSQSEVLPTDDRRVFYKLSAPKKLVVMLGGPFMNLVIATVLFGGLLVFHGTQTVVDGVQVAGVAQCVRPVQAVSTTAGQTPAASTQACTSKDAPSPAAAAGLKPGDIIRSIDGTSTDRVADIAPLVRPKAGQQITLVVERGSQTLTLHATPIANTMPKLDAQGNAVTGAGGQPETVTVGYLGTSNAPLTQLRTHPVTEVPGFVYDQVKATASLILQLPQKLTGVAQSTFTSAPRDVNGPVSVVGIGRVAGEVSSGSVAGIETVGDRLVFLVGVLASLNVALFVFNLVPLLPLDGGHAVGAVWEGLKRSFARMTGRPDPGYVDVALALPIAYAVSLVLIAMTVLITWADIVKPVSF